MAKLPKFLGNGPLTCSTPTHRSCPLAFFRSGGGDNVGRSADVGSTATAAAKRWGEGAPGRGRLFCTVVVAVVISDAVSATLAARVCLSR